MAERYTTKKGTVFIVDDGKVTINRIKQPQCDVPLRDIKEFVEKHDNGEFVSVPDRREEI